MPTDPTTLYVGGLVFDGTGRMHDGVGVLVEAGRIKSVEPAGSFDGFAGTRIDTSGGTLMPGLIDCHVHLLYGAEPDPASAMEKKRPGEMTVRGYEFARRTLAGGITGVRDCGGRDYHEFAIRDACNAGRLPGPSVSAAGQMICMTGGHGSRLGRVADGEQEVIKAVREQIHAGCDFIKIMATGGVMTPGVRPEDAHYTEGELRAGIHEGKRFNKRSASHAQGTQGVLNATRAGITSIEHGFYLDETCIREMREAGTFLVATLAALENILANAATGIPDYIVDKASEAAQSHRASVRAFYDAGGKLAMGTDAGTPFNRHGENAQELRHLVSVGVTPLDALVAGTSRAAELIGWEDRGAIVEGHQADLLIVNGDPVADISAASEPANHRLVVKGGQAVDFGSNFGS